MIRCDNEFVDALKNYVDHGLDCDASKMRTGQREMLELQSLLQTAGMSLLRWSSQHMLCLATLIH